MHWLSVLILWVFWYQYFECKKRYLGGKNDTRVLNKYCWCILYPGKLSRYKIITIHIRVKLKYQTNKRNSRGFENWAVENDWYYWGWGARQKLWWGDEKNGDLKTHLQMKPLLILIKYTSWKLNPKISCENWIQHII